MTAAVGTRSHPGLLVTPVMRHTIVAVGAAIAVYFASAQLPTELATWLLVGAALGAAAAIVSMGWLGLPFLMVGSVGGLLLEYHLRFGPTPEAAHTLVDNLAVHGVGLAAAVVGYLAVTLVLAMVRRRRQLS